MKKRVTARDVAELAGVSRTTVSFVLNNVPGMRISEATRRRVLRAARELHYQPDASARRLVTGRTRILAYVERQGSEHAFSDAFLPQVLRGVHDAASASHYEVLFAPIPLKNGRDRCSRLLRGHHVDGIILSGPRTDDNELRQLLESGAPLVLQGRWRDQPAASVDVDNVAAARMATEHLIRLGHHRLGIVLHAPLEYTAAADRLEGFRAALDAHGLTFDPHRMAVALFTPASGEQALRKVMAMEPQPTALFITSDTVCIGAMRAAERMGLRIPQDLAVVGFDDIPMATYIDPPLTTVRLPAYGLGWGAADLLIRMITHEEVRERNVILDTELVIRNSCGASETDGGGIKPPQ